jgi:hypothetical protein
MSAIRLLLPLCGGPSDEDDPERTFQSAESDIRGNGGHGCHPCYSGTVTDRKPYRAIAAFCATV